MINFYFFFNCPLPEPFMFVSQNKLSGATRLLEETRKLMEPNIAGHTHVSVVSDINAVSISISGFGSRLKVAHTQEDVQALYDVLNTKFPGTHGALHLLNWDTPNGDILQSIFAFNEGRRQQLANFEILTPSA